MIRSRATAVAAMAVLATLLGGCSVPVRGQMAIGINSEGTFQVYLRTCGERLDGATLYWPDDPNGAESNEEVFVEWAINAGSDPTRSNWPLTGTGQGEATATTEPLTTVPASPKTMALYAWTADNEAQADGPFQFTAADLTGLNPDELLVPNNADLSSDQPNKTVTRDEFDAIDCTHNGFG